MLVEFPLKSLYSTIYRKNFKIYGVHIPRKCIGSRYLYLCLSPLKIPFPPNSCHHGLSRRKLLIPPGSILSKICFPNSRKGGTKLIICFIIIQSENMKMTWNFRFFYIFYHLQFFQMSWLYSFVNNIYHLVLY